MSEPEFIDGDIGRVAVHHLGGTGDQTLLVSHATGFLGRVYRALAAELSDTARVVAFDFRGHGDSDSPHTEDGFDWQAMTNDLEAVVDHIGADSLHGFGHSMGGAALLEAERRRPGTFTTAMVYEPIVPSGEFGGASPISQAALGRLRTFPTHADALRRYASKPPLGLLRADVLNDYVSHGFAETSNGVTLKCTPEHESATFEHAGTIQLDSLSEISLDAVVAKSGDGGLPCQLADSVAENLPQSTLMHFPTLSHFGPLQDPVSIANTLRNQLA